MCFLPVRGKRGTHRHIANPFIHTITVNKTKLGKIADMLGIPAKDRRKLKAGKLHLVNEATARRK